MKVDKKGATPTQYIAQLAAPDTELASLLDFWFTLPGLSPSSPDSFGKSPIDLAGDFPQRSDRVRRMEEYGA